MAGQLCAVWNDINGDVRIFLDIGANPIKQVTLALMSETFELTLTGNAYGGESFGRDADGRMVFVPFTLPGEVVRVRPMETHKRWARALPEKWIESSDQRIEPRCPHFQTCGGCHYQHIPYALQLAMKTGIVRDQLERIGGFEDPPIQSTIPSPNPWNYRNNMRFHITEDGYLGFVTFDGQRVFHVKECHLPEQELTGLWAHLDLDPTEIIEEISLRSGGEGEQMVILHGTDAPDIDISIESPSSVVWTSPRGDFILAGQDYFYFDINRHQFRVSALSFFQVNTKMIPELVHHVTALLSIQPGQTIFDLYAGVGLFSAALAESGAHVVAVEESPHACRDFGFNLEQFTHIDLYEGSVGMALPQIKPQPDAVLIDPPRAGLSRQALDSLLERSSSHIVYVSCDPATLSRDGKRLRAGGYSLESLTPIDLFPQTFHIETISLWTR
ncbi:MAG: class I SAM-dependent RNA methyltransferase [Anaerolineales bacterium]